MAKELTPFSKEPLDYPTVKNDEYTLREGFLDNCKMTKVDKPKMPAHMVGGMEWDHGQDYSHHGGDENHPAFKARSDDGQPAFPAPFSKKEIRGGPAKPTTPA